MGFTHEQEQNIYIARLTMGAISLCCSLIVVLVFLSFKELRYFFMRLVIYMILADMVRSFSLMLPSDYTITCKMQGILLEYGLSSSIIWTLMIAVALYQGIVKECQTVERYERLFMLAGYGIPVLLTALPGIFDLYGNTGGWCWISTKNNFLLGSILRFSCFYGILTIIIIVIVILYSKIIKTIRIHLDGITQEESSTKEMIRKIVFFPLIVIICYGPSYVFRVLDFLTDDKTNSYPFAMVVIIIGMCTGILNAFVYGYNESVRKAFRTWFRKESSQENRISLAQKSAINYSEIHSTF